MYVAKPSQNCLGNETGTSLRVQAFRINVTFTYARVGTNDGIVRAVSPSNAISTVRTAKLRAVAARIPAGGKWSGQFGYL